jgi:hypothetical protein
MKANRPLQAFVIPIKPALNQIADHGNQLIEARALRGHFRFVAGGDQHVVVPLDLENELFHAFNLTDLPRESNFSFAPANAKMRGNEPARGPASEKIRGQRIDFGGEKTITTDSMATQQKRL